jgi:ATP adenylyltransferase
VYPETGIPDAWQRIWTPHRSKYLSKARKDGTVEQECPFCYAHTASSEFDLVTKRGITGYVVLNLYPYNAGHVLVTPYRHFADITEATDEELLELNHLTQEAMATLRKVANAQGFNIGINQGAIAGTSVADHLHQHIVPRWGGDTNFMPVIGRAKAMNQLLEDTRDLLKSSWVDL